MLQRGLKERKCVLELALEELKRQKAGIDAEIASIQSELRIEGSAVRQTRAVPSAGKRSKTTAQRRGASLRMKEIWAARRKAKAAKKSGAAKAPATGAKIRPKTEADKRALSLKMKEAWKKPRAEAAREAKAAK
jgi:hypothetical protein